MQNFLLRHVALHLHRKRNHPPDRILPILSVRMNAARHIHALDRAALRLSRPIPPKHPTVSLQALMERHLLTVNFFTAVIRRQTIVFLAALQFLLDFVNFFDDLSHFSLFSPKIRFPRLIIMLVMKKLLFSLFTALVYLFLFCVSTRPCPVLTAKATSDLPTAVYACVLNDDTYLYATKIEKSGLFVLPQTYYVKALSTDADFCKVEYLTDGATTKKLTGYCKTSELTFVDYTPQTPYFYYSFDLTYYIDADSKDSPLLDKITIPCAYYGSYKIGATTYCYVLRDNDFGYVPLPDDFVFTKNTEYETYNQAQSSKPDEPTDAPATQTPSENPVQIAIIVLLCLLIPILAALILRQPKKSLYEWEET